MGDVLKFRPRPKPEGPQKTVDYDNLAAPNPHRVDEMYWFANTLHIGDLEPVELCGECMGKGGSKPVPARNAGFTGNSDEQPVRASYLRRTARKGLGARHAE